MVKGKAPSPRMPRVARITKLEQLLPRAREMVSRKPAEMYEGVLIKEGQKVLFINDTTADQLVVEALRTAAMERGAHVNTITLEGFRGLTEPGEMLDSMCFNNWYPKWVWEAANDQNLVLLTAFLKTAHAPIPPLSGNPPVKNLEITADLMVDEYQNFPVELRDKIDAVAWENLVNSTKVKWTDPEGTDLTVGLTVDMWTKAMEKQMARTGTPYQHGHLMFPAPSLDMNGVWATSSVTFGGPIPRTTMQVKKGQVVKVEGGGPYGKRLRDSFAKYADLKSRCPGPGVNWITTIGICTNPKARRSPFFDELAGSARVYAWTFGHRRSGIIHTSVGEGMATPLYKVIRHMDTCFNTLETDKGPVIENGHLLALDDPRVREVASKFGDPDKLLKEAWIPAVPGINA